MIGRLERASARPALAALIVLIAGLLVYFPRLGVEGLRSTEGHRAIPAWEILSTGEWLPTRLFETVYVRKPPGMPWAIAAASSVLGETELAARIVSALSVTAMGLVAFFFAGRWFGWRTAVIAGLAQTLMPRLWSAGRTADIEALLCLGVQIAALTMVDALAERGGARPPASRWAWAVLGAAGLIIAVLAKAHAGLPVIAGVIAAALVVHRRPRVLLRPEFAGAIVLALAALTPLAFRYARLLQQEAGVSEDFSRFLWSLDRLGEWATFPVVVTLSGLPAALALMFPWGPDARREAESDAARGAQLRLARCLGVAFFCAIGVYMLFGVSNPRYAMPALVLLPPIAGYVAAGTLGGWFMPARRAIARLCVLGSVPALTGVMLVLAGLNIGVFEPRDARSSARPAAAAVAPALPDGAQVWADGFVRAKPELLWYAARDAGRLGARVRCLWKHREIAAAVLPAPGVFLLLNEREYARYVEAGHGPALEERARGVADTTPFGIWRVKAPADGAPAADGPAAR
ncbi:MAG: glycosyltransferase family 39 protein [Planctomycetota bacterium]|nr:glycosyltransferase family 39 protein [Planctomycetota bacterium]